MSKELKSLAEKLAEILEKPEASIGDASRLVEGVDRRELCQVAERLKPLVSSYAPIEEGSLPSNAYLALEAIVEALERACRGNVNEELVAAALAALGLLAKGKTARAASLAAMISARLRRVQS